MTTATAKLVIGGSKHAIIDAGLFAKLSEYKWRVTPNGYVRSSVPVEGERFLHRIVNRTPLGFVTDHINRNKLDNRRCNLRSATGSMNGRNVKRRKDAGVFRDRYGNRRKKWRASTGVHGWFVMIGRFESKKAAIAAYRSFVRWVENSLPAEIDAAAIRRLGAVPMGMNRGNRRRDLE